MSDSTPTSAAPLPPAAPTDPGKPPRRGVFGRLMVTIGVMAVVTSLLLNLTLFMAVAFTAGGPRPRTATRTLTEGNVEEVVAVYKLRGAIMPEAVTAFDGFHEDVIDNENVKAVVLRVVSPGGSVASSDQIHQMVL